MARAFGIINFAGNHIQVEGMQAYRPVGSFSFLGRYRVIDFQISNMSNSGIDHMQVYIRRKPQSLTAHLGTGRHYNINSKRGRLQILYAELGTGFTIYNNDIAAYMENMEYIEKEHYPYVIIAPSYMIYTANYSELLQNHIDSGADITLLYHSVDTAKEYFLNCFTLNLNRQKGLLSIDQNHGNAKNRNIFMDTYIMKKELFIELKSDAWIESRQGVGYIVAAANDENDAQDERGGEGAQPGRVNWVSEVAEKYLDMEKTFDDLFQRFTDESHYSLGSGVASREVYTSERVAGDIAALLTGSGPCQYFFSPYKGDKFLRQKLVAFLGTKGVKASSGEIQILSETNQALDFIVTLLVKPGDSVVMEEPVHPDMYRVMELAGAKILTVPVDENGMNCEVLESLLTQTRPRLIFVNSSYHDPTGNILSLERRKKIVELSNRYRVPIVEEDAASELVYDGDKLPPIKAFDTTGNVIYIYSFSLTFIPGLSLAFVTGNRDLIRALSYLVSVRLMASDWMTQKLLGMYLDDGIYYTSLLKFRDVYRTNRDLVCQKLDELAPLGVSYTKPRGGVYVWCRLPDGVDSKRFIRRAYNMGVTLIPGHVFYPCKNGGRDHIRINYSYESYERLGQGMDVLRKALEEELEE